MRSSFVRHEAFGMHFYYLHCWLLLLCCHIPWPRFSSPQGQESRLTTVSSGEDLRGFCRWGWRTPAAVQEPRGCVCNFLPPLIPTARGQDIWTQRIRVLQPLFLKSIWEKLETVSGMATRCWWHWCAWENMWEGSEICNSHGASQRIEHQQHFQLESTKS